MHSLTGGVAWKSSTYKPVDWIVWIDAMSISGGKKLEGLFWLVVEIHP
jgi:hypothetical protein